MISYNQSGSNFNPNFKPLSGQFVLQPWQLNLSEFLIISCYLNLFAHFATLNNKYGSKCLSQDVNMSNGKNVQKGNLKSLKSNQTIAIKPA